jgi:hypothetical protein
MSDAQHPIIGGSFGIPIAAQKIRQERTLFYSEICFYYWKAEVSLKGYGR